MGDVLFVDFFFQEAAAGLLFVQAGLFGGELALELGELAVFQLSGAIEIVLALGFFDVDFDLFDLLAQRTQALHAFLLGLPLRLEGGGFGLQVGDFLF